MPEGSAAVIEALHRVTRRPTRKRPVNPRRPASVPQRKVGVFAEPVAKVSPVGDAPQKASERYRRAAEALPAEHQLPRFPTLRTQTPAQRKFIARRTEQAVRKVAAQRGMTPSEAASKLYSEGDRQTRRTLDLYGRAVREERDVAHAKALHGVLNAPIAPNLRALTRHEREQYRKTGTLQNPLSVEGKKLLARQRTQAELRHEVAGLRLTTRGRAHVYRALTATLPSEAQPGQKRSGAQKAGYSALAFIRSPDRNLAVAAAPGFKALAGPVAKDLISLPRDVVTSGYYVGAGLVEGAQGDTKRLRAIGKSLKEHDPLVLAAQGRWREAGKAVGEHPLNAVLEAGGLRAVPRAAGRLGRVSTARDPAVLPGTAVTQAREFSRSPLSKRIQRAVDAHQTNRAEKAYATARAADDAGDVPAEQVAELYNRAAELDPRIVSQRYVEHRADVREAMGQPARRRGRAEVKKAMAPLEVAPRKGGHLQRLIVEGHAPLRRTADGAVDTNALRRDLADYRDDLATEAKTLKGRKLAANKKLRARIDEGLKLDDAQLHDLASRSGEISRLTNAQEARNIEAQQLHPEEARVARVKTYAVRQMGARVQVESARMNEWRGRAAEARAQRRRPPKKPEPVLTVAETRSFPPAEARAAAAALERQAVGAGGKDAAALRAQADQLRQTGKVEVRRLLPPGEVEAHMRANGVDPADVAFVTQREGALGAGAFNVRSLAADLTRKGLPTQTRTGSAVIQGLIDTHPSRLTANVVRLQQLEAADKNYVSAIHEVAAREPEGEIRTFGSKGKGEEWKREAMYDEQGNRIHGAPKWRIVRINPWGGREGQLRQLLDKGDPDGFMATEAGVRHPISESIAKAVSSDATGEGPWAAVPEAWANRIGEHADVYKSSSPTLRAVSMMFRNTVLPLSLPWLTGNFSEAALRTVIKSPRVLHNVITYRRVMKVLERTDPQEAAVLRDQLGVGHFGMSETSNVHTSLAQFSGKRMRYIAAPLAKARHAPVIKWLPEAYGRYTDFVFHTVNEMLERPFREAMAGHHIRQQFGSPVLHRMTREAIHDAARGLKNTNAQVRMADEVRRAYGQYEAFSPAQRKFIVLYSPFAAWSLNAVRFLFDVLPRDHPALTGVLAAANTVSDDWRKKHGLDEFVKGHVHGYMLGTIPTPGGGHMNAARYTPFGFFGDPAGSTADLVLPQFSGTLHALLGQDWTGQPLKKHEEANTLEKIGAALSQQTQSVVPFYGRVQQALGYEGSVYDRIWRSENPFKVWKKKTPGAAGVTLPKGAHTGGGDELGHIVLPEPSGVGSGGLSEVVLP